MRVGIVADDLTGAMDSAAPFADRSLATRVLLSEAGGESRGGEPEVLALDTHSRDLPPDAASRAVRAAVARLGPDCLPFKKIDSTLRGNIAAEIAAAMQASGRICAVVAPAAPAQGRVLMRGHLFVNGQQVGSMSLTETLRKAFPGVPVRALRAGEPVGDEHCVLVADAGNEQDLAQVAALGLARPASVLLVGSSGLAFAVADGLGPVQAKAARPQYERLIIVVGSHHARSAEQVRSLQEKRSVTTGVLTHRGELRRLPSQGDGRVTLLHVEGLDAAPTLDPRLVASQLGDATAQLLAAHGNGRTALFMTGGDTARAILSRLQVDGIDVIGNLDPGIVHGRVVYQGRQLGVVTKSGGFGGPDTFIRAAADLVPAGP